MRLETICSGTQKNPAGAVPLVGATKGPTVSHRAIELCSKKGRYPIALTLGFLQDYIPTCHLLDLELSRAYKEGKAAALSDSS